MSSKKQLLQKEFLHWKARALESEKLNREYRDNVVPKLQKEIDFLRKEIDSLEDMINNMLMEKN